VQAAVSQRLGLPVSHAKVIKAAAILLHMVEAVDDALELQDAKVSLFIAHGEWDNCNVAKWYGPRY
jgi:hypothetical protein